MRFRICGICGAALDPGEHCDCRRITESQTFGDLAKKNTAHDAANIESGKMEIGLTINISTSNCKANKGENQVCGL